MRNRGRAWKFGDDVNTDIIIAGKYKLSITDMDELSKHAMEAARPEFAGKVQKGDFVVAGRNFGCGSSREQAPLVLQHLGIATVVAKSFARIFYRNAINIGLPVVECERADEIQEGDFLEVDLARGQVKNLTKSQTYNVKPLPPQLHMILSEGGLVRYVKKNGKLPW
jgi:3-isopropylmalate/(R)-2-methylmalate dehydratase small subunit